ncbi:alpha-amylase family glycosyl hydrolase [Tunicatimonas pelagia]|uniref:alpha-amylase family glycosyl hydrolase n=1 Tax=Tunicatimonas pelagia TaxID=931531 RepID=UPI002665DEE7|nr:alpha-amylase family glycosyl hydrolase [Tunicatimonas pelagia]WKN41211.1 alpha-amylase family glycosyl hydrolase [Tunicatimonas pelagia]
MNTEELKSIAQEDPNLLLEESLSPDQKVVVYQIFTRLFGNTVTNNVPWGTAEENGVGKFNDIDETALAALSELGATYIWYTGVIEHAVLNDYREYGIPLDDADVVKGRAGSPYAIKDYYDVNPDLAEDVPNRMTEFEALVKRTHDEGLKVIIDFVPNHVARFYQSDAKPDGTKDFGAGDDTNEAFFPDNNFYYLVGKPFQVPADYQSLGEHTFPTKDGTFDENPAKATGNDQFTAQPSVNDWFETVKLNYGVDYLNDRRTHFDPIPNTWQKMLDILLYWSGRGVDGFRCDMAEMVPVEFWHWVIPKVKDIYPNLIFIAEIYNPEQYRNYIDTGRFDYLYDKVQLYDTLRAVIEEQGSVQHLPDIWQYLRDKNRNMLRFLENHDEQRIASRFFGNDPTRAKPAIVVSTLWHSGPVMVYFGQEVGEPAEGESGFSGNDGRTTIFDYWGVPEYQKWVNDGLFDGGQLSEEQRELREFYRDLLNLAQEEAIRSGYFYDLHPHNRHFTEGYNDQVYAFLRFTGNQRLLIVSNFDAHNTHSFNLKIPVTATQAMGLPEGSTYSLQDIFQTETTATMNTSEVIISEGDAGIPMNLPPLTSYIFTIQPNE